MMSLQISPGYHMLCYIAGRQVRQRCKAYHWGKQQMDQQTAMFEDRCVEGDTVTRQGRKAHHQTEVEDSAYDIKAGVFEAEEVQVLAAQLHDAGGGGVSRRTVVLPAPP